MATADHPATRHFLGNREWEACIRAASASVAGSVAAISCMGGAIVLFSNAMLVADSASFGTAGAADWTLSTAAINR
jgi:hypothetical protein